MAFVAAAQRAQAEALLGVELRPFDVYGGVPGAVPPGLTGADSR